MGMSVAFRLSDAAREWVAASVNRISDPARVMVKAEGSRFWGLNPGSGRLSEIFAEFRTSVTDPVLCHPHVLLPLAGFRFSECVDPASVSYPHPDFGQVVEQ